MKKEYEIKLTPEEVAELFAGLGSDGQAAFYNHLSEISSDWLPMQLQAITDDDGLTLAGRRVMQGIGDYSHWGLCNFRNNGLGLKQQR